MREILFRGQRIDNGEWVYGYYVCDETGQISEEPIAFIYHLNNHPCGWDLIPFEVIPETVGQFIGLLDKNGTKIFEGDIVKDRWTNGIVTFGKHRIDCCGCCYSYHNTIGFYVDEGKGSICSDEDTWDNFEVIGTIHDNPELMEVQDG